VDVTYYVGMKEMFAGSSGFQISVKGILGMVTIFKLIFVKPAMMG
jgi:hypothetical protein